MELFNYIRNSGYERESPFVNDVKFHPVLKARKTFASGILAAFTSDVNEKPNSSMVGGEEEQSQDASTASYTTSSLFGRLKNKLTL